jgi:hypothetical protein
MKKLLTMLMFASLALFAFATLSHADEPVSKEPGELNRCGVTDASGEAVEAAYGDDTLSCNCREAHPGYLLSLSCLHSRRVICKLPAYRAFTSIVRDDDGFLTLCIMLYQYYGDVTEKTHTVI